MNDAVECFVKGLESTYRKNENYYHSLVNRFLFIALLLKDNDTEGCHEQIEDTFHWLKNEVKYPIEDEYQW